MTVVFLNTLYRPSREKLYELLRMQEEIYRTKVKFTYRMEENTPPGVVAQRKQECHKNFLRTWELHQGGISDTYEPPEN